MNEAKPLCDSRVDTYRHKSRVQHFITLFAGELLRRGVVHDDSKLVTPEVEGYNSASGRLAGLTYGSEEYKANLRSDDIKGAIAHHHAKNSHHPEYYSNGVCGMSLADLVEMFCDWMAATERQNDGNIHTSVEKNRERFKLDPQLVSIMLNTIPLLCKKE